jgi:hypothetical protein
MKDSKLIVASDWYPPIHARYSGNGMLWSTDCIYFVRAVTRSLAVREDSNNDGIHCLSHESKGGGTTANLRAISLAF